MAKPIIEQVIVQTLRRLTNRHHVFLGGADARRIPYNRIIFSDGVDNLDYNDDMKAIADAAAADGFHWVSDYAQGKSDEHTQQTPATVAQAWNFASNLRYIIDSGKISLIIWDDKMINVQWRVLNEIVEYCHNLPEELYAIQLVIRGHEEDIGFEPLSNDERKKMSTETFNAIFDRLDAHAYARFFFTRGIAGYDESFVLTPEGARWMLNALGSSTNFYNYVDHFIKQELPLHAEKAHKLGKGVYCPAEIGYKFVRQSVPLGSTTDWIPKEHPNYENVHKTAEINFLSDFNGEPVQETTQNIISPQGTVSDGRTLKQQLEEKIN